MLRYIKKCIKFGCEIFFFFQAEDGIRDKLVTGVQTCALPISLRKCGFYVLDTASGAIVDSHFLSGFGALSAVAIGRSEERRVGEEWRSRGAPDHLKKKKNHTYFITKISS